MNKPTEKGMTDAAQAPRKLTKKGGELIAEFLVKEKIPYVFGICGHGNVGLLDPLYEVRDKIKLVSPRHEQVAGHMADGYFRVQHQPVATLTSCGPGSANLIMAMAVAQTDSSAVLAITANVPTSQFNRGPFQELNRHNQADFPNVIRPVVKRSFQPTRVDMLPLALRQAVTTTTSGRPGPVNVDMPFNVFQEEADVELEPHWDGFLSRAQRRLARRHPRDALDMLRGRAPPGDLHRPRRDAVGGVARSSPSSRTQLPHPGDQLAQRHGLPRHDAIRCRSASSAATAPIRPTRPAATPTW